jgi:hypothetical protein
VPTSAVRAIHAELLREHGGLQGPARRRNEKVLTNYFCNARGIFTYIGDGENAKDGYRVNLGCVESLDPLGLEITIIDDKTLPLVRSATP